VEAGNKLGESVLLVPKAVLDAAIQGVSETRGQTFSTSSTYENEKNVHINVYLETFNL
jgi:hypothetical protein